MLRDLPLRHLDEALAPWRERTYTRPRVGWLRAIREALGMTTRQLAKAVAVAPSTAIAAEQAEARGDITLGTLQRYAAALGCEVQYALVPKKNLQQVVEERAEDLARQEVDRVRHSMALEGQSTGSDHRTRQIDDLRRKLLEGRRSRLWQ